MDTKKLPIPETMLEAVRRFADPDVAHDFFVQIRFPDGAACPRCGSVGVTYMPKVRRWYCNDCKKQSSLKVGTIFEDSPIGFDKWLPAIWLIASNRNGISSCELARALKVTQKTAWFMLHRIRLAMASGSFSMLQGIVEVDEAYIGGKKRSKSQRAALKPFSRDQTAVLGMVERKGNVRAFVLPSARPGHADVLPRLRATVHHDATLYSDTSVLYTNAAEHFLYHDSVNHSVEECVRGAVHTNTIENFWSVLKRTLGGTYISVRPWQLHAYLDEQIFRYNERENTDGRRFAKALDGAYGKRVTYKTLTGKAKA